MNTCSHILRILPFTFVLLSGLSAAPGEPNDIAALLRHGEAQINAGESAAAAQTFARVLALAPEHPEAVRQLQRLAADSVDGSISRIRTSAEMLNAVGAAWQPPPESAVRPAGAVALTVRPLLAARLETLTVPAVVFNGLPLDKAVAALSALTEELDETGESPRGVNIVLLDPAASNPRVSLTLRQLPLRRVLELLTESVGYEFSVEADAVIVRPGAGKTDLHTEFFPVARATVLRLTGRAAEKPGTGDPLAGGKQAAEIPVANPTEEGRMIREFLEMAGVGFANEPGATMAFDGSQLIVTQTRRNLERVRNILVRYREVRQVEIEARFMEVQDGALEELGIHWSAATSPDQQNAGALALYQTANRTLAGAFTNLGNNREGRIVGGDLGLDQPIANHPPVLPGANNLGVGAEPIARITGRLGEFNVGAVVRALAQKSGTELLSAPRLTVLSGNPAVITVAQELRYPQSYGQVQSQVGTGSASGGGSAGVAITAGTPQDFTTRNIGVELKVTPTVEEDGRSISLDLNPKVTEFEGFVEYGGQSIAIAGSPPTTVTIPSGFYQPIFGVRELSTTVTIWDGATIVMGGLTREDVRKSNDKVPVLGNVPVLGRLFRSRGESAQKRNLLIFVTARLVSPGGMWSAKPVPVPAGSASAEK